MTTEQTLLHVLSRNYFYRRLFYLVQVLIVLVVMMIVLLVGLLAYLLHHRPSPLYFPTKTSGELVHIQPVSEPFPIEMVTAWTLKAVQAAFAYDFVHYRQQLQDAQTYFTAYGWYNYMRALEASNNLTTLTQRKQVVLVNVSQPVLLKGGILSGAYAWQFQIPMQLTYWNSPFSGTSKYSNQVTATVIVQRQPVLQSDHGLGIVQLIVSVPVATNTAPQQLSINPSA